MSWYTKEKAKFFLNMGLANKEQETANYIYFKVKSYDVTYDKRKDYWNCVCVHGSLWRGNKDEKCSHILAAQMLMEKKENGTNM